MAKRSHISPVAPGTQDLAADFAQWQILSNAPAIEGGGPVGRSLQQVLRELHDSEINVGLQSFAWCGLRVWIGDQLNGLEAEATLEPKDATWADDDAVARWLHETALRLFPESDHARRWQ